MSGFTGALFSLHLLLCLIFNSTDATPLKILINSPTFAYAHSKFQETLARKLAAEGHNVTILSVRINTLLNYTAPRNVRNINVINVDRPTSLNPALAIKMVKEPFNGHQNMFVDGYFAVFGQTMADVCEESTNNQELMDQLRLGDFDVGISEEVDMCAFAIFHYAGIKTKIISNTLPLYLSVAELYGISLPSSYVPNWAAASLDAPYMSFLNRARALFYNTIEMEYFAKGAKKLDESILEKNFGPLFPSLTEIMKNTSLIFVNQFDHLDMPHPISSKVVSIGGVCFRNPQELKQELRDVFKSARSGVVLVAFGSLADVERAPDVQLAMIKTFARFVNHSFVWKMTPANSKVEMAIQSAGNIFPFEWVDQISILNQSSLKAFITHCGLNSYQESAWAGVPMVGIPLFADQLYNCAAMKFRGLGVVVDILDVLESDDSSLYDALTEVLNNPGYAENAREMSRKLRAQPFSAGEKLTKYVKFAAQFENFNELNLPYHDEIGFFQYYSVDVVLAAVAFVSTLAIVAVIIPIHFFLSVVCFRSKTYY